MAFWERVSAEIKRQKTTQDWVASKIPVRADTFSRWVQRDTMPDASQVVAIAHALATTVEYLVTGNENVKWKPPPRIAGIVENLQMLNDEQLKLVDIQVQALADSLKIQRETSL